MATFGKVIPGLEIDGQPAPYPVVNERAVRATAGLMLGIGLVTLFTIVKTGNYTMLYVVVPLFWLDFLLKVVFGPAYSIFGFFGRRIVSKQKPEYVGAIQKRFAWSMGLILASAMMILAIGFGVRGAVPFAICMTCLTFMWMEAAFGICVGCKIYGFLLERGIMKEPEYRPACPGGACSLKKKNQ